MPRSSLGTPATCAGCSAPIYWQKTASGKQTPVNPDGSSHWATCPRAEQFSKKPQNKQKDDDFCQVCGAIAVKLCDGCDRGLCRDHALTSGSLMLCIRERGKNRSIRDTVDYCPVCARRRGLGKKPGCDHRRAAPGLDGCYCPECGRVVAFNELFGGTNEI